MASRRLSIRVALALLSLARINPASMKASPYPERWLCFYPQTKALAEQDVLAAATAGKNPDLCTAPALDLGRKATHI